MVESQSLGTEFKKNQLYAHVEMFNHTSSAYVEVSSSLSNTFAMTWGSLHNTTLQVDVIIFYFSCGWRPSLSIRLQSANKETLSTSR